MAGGRPHTSGAVAVGGTSRAGMRSQIVLAQPSQKGPGWAAALDPRRAPKMPGADVAANGLAISSLVDDFSDGVVDPAVWPDSFGTYSETGGRARVQCDTGYNAYSSALAYRLAESQVSLRVFPPKAGGASTEAWCQVLIKQQTNGTDIGFEVSPLSGLLKMFSRTGFFDAGEVDIAYDPVAHAWLRVRETGGNVYWETSPEGVFWTTQRTLASPTWVWDPNLEFQLISHRSDGTVDYAEFDNVNVTHIKDDFDSYSTASTWAEGSTHGPWQVEFLGLAGQVVPVDVTGEGRVLQLEAVDQASTSSTLVVSAPRTVGDVHWRSRLRTVAQLHTTPNAWEVAWFVWNYDEPSPSTRRYYYVALKTGGFELGKVDQSIGLSGGQRFLWTDSTAFTVGTWYNLEVRQDGARIRVWIDGTLRADFTDGPGSGGSPSWGTAGEIVMTGGSVGMYHEDARVQFGNVLWVDELTGDASLAVTATQTADGATSTGGVTGNASAAVTASLSAAGTVAAAGSVTSSVTAGLTAAGAAGLFGAGSLSASTGLSAAGVRATVGDASLATTAGLSAAGSVARFGDASLAVTVSLSAAGTVQKSADGVVSATAGLTTAGQAGHVGSGSLPASVGLSAAGNTQQLLNADLSVGATLTASGVAAMVGAAGLAVSVALQASGAVTPAVQSGRSGPGAVAAPSAAAGVASSPRASGGRVMVATASGGST